MKVRRRQSMIGSDTEKWCNVVVLVCRANTIPHLTDWFAS